MLPIEQFKETIIRTVNENTITIIQSATGSGKSTKVPVYLAEAGYKVLVTQPRRLAAVSLAKKVAQDSGDSDYGNKVGFHTGLKSNFSENSQILFLTEGTELIRQLANKEDLSNTILIIDEIHEWSINVDVLLAISKKLIADGNNLKLVLMSATLESDKLSKFLDNAPVISVPNKSYRITSINRKSEDLEDVIFELTRRKQNILVFLPGKSEIDQLRTNLYKTFKSYGLAAEILTLHADLSYEEQLKVFYRYWVPKVILSTNIAQTSITIADIDVVVDTGLDKKMVSSDGVPTLIQSNVSKSDIIQRKGSVGRCKPGVYYLCSDFKYESRHEYPIPEIEYSSLENILLSLINFRIDIKELDFFHTPDWDNVESSLVLLQKLGAIDTNKEITKIGKEMCKLPLDVRFARMVVEAKKYGDKVVSDVLICALIAQVGGICKDYNNEIANSIKSDFICELELFKSIYGGKSIPLEIYNKVNYDKIVEYIPKLVSILDITISLEETDLEMIKNVL